MTMQNQYVKSKLGSPTDTSKIRYLDKNPSVPPQPQVSFDSGPGPTLSPSAPSAPVSSPSQPSAPASPFDVQPEKKPVEEKRELPTMPGAGGVGGGGGGASGKMLYKPNISQSRMSALRASLGLPLIKPLGR